MTKIKSERDIMNHLERICKGCAGKGVTPLRFKRENDLLCMAIDALKGNKTCEYQGGCPVLDYDVHGKEMFGYWRCGKG